MKLVNHIALLSVVAISTCCCTQDKTKVACIGDSITEGFGIEWQSDNSYPAFLDSILGNEYEVMNFGRSSTTMMKEGNFPYWSAKEFRNAIEYIPDIAIIKLGTNDAKLFQWNTEKYMQSYQSLIDTLKSANPQMIIKLCLPVWVAEDRWEITDSVITNFVVPAVKEMADINQLEVIDLFTHLKGKGELYLKDGIHPNRAGALSMAEKVAEHIK